MNPVRVAGVLAALAILSWITMARANDVPVINGQRALPDDRSWQLQGTGETRFFGLALYDASFWIVADRDATPWSQAPHALLLRYRRDFSSDTLVEASLREMKRLGASEADLARWKAPLARAFPDVKTGDTITGIHWPGRGAAFLHQARPTSQWDDPTLARQFFAIWLDPRSRDPDLRKRLLGPLGAS